MRKISRRQFLNDSVLMLAAASLPGKVLAQAGGSGARQKSANEKLNAAVIGCGSRGDGHVSEWLRREDVDLIAVCDADSAHMKSAMAKASKAGKKMPRAYRDFRDLLENPDIDVVSIATPNHTHAIISIMAMQAGKDVYVEKPVCHNIFEGHQMVRAARKHGRICQAGTQSRSNPGMRDAIQYLHDGKLGKITLARGLCYKSRPSIGLVTQPQPVPETVDYDLWLGPAPNKPPMRERFHYDWHWFWDYGNGDLGNQGAHEMDKARWGLNKRSFPESVIGYGGRFGYKDNGETPNTEVLILDYGDEQIIFEVRGLATDPLKGAKIGNIWYGTEGYMVSTSYNSAAAYDNDGKELEQFKGSGDHFANFVDAVRSRKSSDLNCDIEDGFISASLCHLGNISYLLGKNAAFDDKAKAFGDDKDAYETFARFEEHLASNGVDLKSGAYRLGRKLRFDAERLKFIGDKRADELLTRDYRAPFVVTDKV
ncbi:MAG: Gfo/Idh/MocA family oxidoreductase [Armatimonadetes bacterium]|nr:Gfo/Idh/MocA family oxidoreductase [Armatimonadota bacterium]